MTTKLSRLALLAPGIANAAAFAKIPEPTPFVPFNTWSPAPTAAPQLPLDLLKRTGNEYTCGYVSGSSGQFLYFLYNNILTLPSKSNNLSKLYANLRNKYILWRPRLLRPLHAFLHPRHTVHPFNCPLCLLHRHGMLVRRRHCKMHSQHCARLLRVAFCLRPHHTDAVWLC